MPSLEHVMIVNTSTKIAAAQRALDEALEQTRDTLKVIKAKNLGHIGDPLEFACAQLSEGSVSTLAANYALSNAYSLSSTREDTP